MLPRYYHPDYLYEVTRRTLDGEFLFDLNDVALMEAIVGALAEAQRRYGVAIYAFHMMSNHYHGLFGAPTPLMFARFLNFFHGSVAMLVNQRLGRRRPVWTSKFRPLAVTMDEKTLMQRMKYIMGQGVRAGIVQHPQQFAGPSTVDWLVAGVPLQGRYGQVLAPRSDGQRANSGLNAGRPPRAAGLSRAAPPSSGGVAPQQAQGGRVLTVEIALLPCFAQLGWAEVQPMFAALADEIAGVAFGELLRRGAPSKFAEVDLVAAGEHGEAEGGETGGTLGEHSEPDGESSGSAEPPPVAVGPDKSPAPSPMDELSGDRQVRPKPERKSKAVLLILTVDRRVRDAYRDTLRAFAQAYRAALQKMTRRLTGAGGRVQVRTARFPDWALLPGCVGGRA